MKKLKYERDTKVVKTRTELLNSAAAEICFSILPFFDRCNETKKKLNDMRAIERVLFVIDGMTSIVVEINIDRNGLTWMVGAHPKFQNDTAVLSKINEVFKISLGEDIIDIFKS